MHFSVRTSEAVCLSSQVQSTRGNQISIRYMPGDRLAYSVVVSKRQGNAVKRNRAKRIIREIMRLRASDVPAGLYLIYINRPCLSLTKEALDKELKTLIERACARQTGMTNDANRKNNS